MGELNFVLESLGSEEKFELIENAQVFEDILLKVEANNYYLSSAQFNQLFRIIHSIKGLMSMFNRNEVPAIHQMESMLKSYENVSPIKEASFNVLLMGIRLVEESIRDDLNYDFSSKLFSKKINTAVKVNYIIFAQSENWQLVKTMTDLGIEDYIVFSNIDEVYKEPTRLKGVNKIIISDLVDNIDPSSLIKVLNFTNRDADILLVREKNKCVLSNVHDINFISYGAKDRNFENRLERFLKS